LAQALVDRTRAQFVLDVSDGEDAVGLTRPVLGAPGDQRLSTDGTSGRLRAVLDFGSISIGADASEPMTITDSRSAISAQIALHDATAASAEATPGYVVYRQGYRGAVDIIERPFQSGIEDYLVFGSAPATREVEYTIALDNAAGLRLVANTLEILDEQGVPRLRMAPPFLADSTQKIAFANVSVSGCAVDTDAAPPWRRRPKAPGAKRCDVHITWSDDDISYPAILDPTWGTTDAMMVERDHHTIALVPGPGVLAIGGVQAGAPATLTELFNPEWSTWTVVGAMNAARYRHTSTVLGDGRVLVAGGSFPYSPAPREGSVEIYDPATGQWAVSGAMRYARSGHTATLLLNGRVLVTGGADEVQGGESKAAEIWDPDTQVWFPAAPMQDGRVDHSATILQDGKRILVAGGYAPVPFAPLTSSEVYDPVADTWTPTYVNPRNINPTPSHMVMPRAKHAAALLGDGSVLVVGGEFAAEHSFEVNDSAELFIDDPNADGLLTRNGWAPGPSCSSVVTFPGICHRFDMGQAVNAFGAVYFIGGNLGSATPARYVTQYPVASNSGDAFGQRSVLPVPTLRPRATLLPDGRIFVVGGRTGPSALPTSAGYALYGVADTLSGADELSTDRTSYVAGEPAEVLFALNTVGSSDYVSIVDTATGNEVAHLATSGKASGSLRFGLSQTGTFVAKAFHVVDNSPPQLLLQSGTFTVTALTGAGVSVDKTTYASSDTITVTFSGMTGTLDEVIGIVPIFGDSPVALRYTMAAPSGIVTFSELAPGLYIAVAYVFDSQAARGYSATFTVTQ
jgi:hypothetical protein